MSKTKHGVIKRTADKSKSHSRQRCSFNDAHARATKRVYGVPVCDAHALYMKDKLTREEADKLAREAGSCDEKF